MKPVLSIIIVNYNTANILRQCLKSLEQESKRAKEQEIIVVDNGSTDNSVKMINDQWLMGNVKLIENQRNLGFAKAVNQGIKKSQGEFILLLNSDIVVKPKAIEKMIEFAQKHSIVGVVGGRLLNPKGSIQGSCYHLPTLSRIIKEFWFGQKNFSVTQKYAPLGNKPIEVEAIVGAVFLIPRKVIEKVGFFDERFFMYFEDLDYCRRVRNASFKIYYLPQAEFIHKHGASGKEIPWQTQKWLRQSSKIYHGVFKYWLITFIIWLGQKFK